MSMPHYPDPGSGSVQPTSADQGRYGHGGGYESTSYDAGPYGAGYVTPGTPTRASEQPGRRLVSGIIGFLGTPVALGMMMYGSRSLLVRQQTMRGGTDEPLDLVLVLVGALLLFGVAAMSTMSGVGPILGGLFWGVLPGVLMFFAPAAPLALYDFSYGLLGQEVQFAALSWTWMGATVAVGVLLAGAGTAAHLVRGKAARRPAQASLRA